MAKPATTRRTSTIDDLRSASARIYAQRAATSFGPAGSDLSEADRRQTYEQGWFDCLSVLLGIGDSEVVRSNTPN